MIAKQNCWEFKDCGRELGGTRIREHGICPAAIDIFCDGLNGGKNAGRICWAVAGTFCGGEVQGSFAKKLSSCVACDFFKKVKQEEDVEEEEGGGVKRFKLLKPSQMFKPHD